MTSKKHGLRWVKLGQLRWQADAQMCEDIWQPQGWGNNDRRGKAETVWCFPEKAETLSRSASFLDLTLPSGNQLQDGDGRELLAKQRGTSLPPPPGKC